MPSVNKIVESALDVEDLDRSAAFYQNLFGFEAMLRNERICAFAVPGNQTFLLFHRGGSREPIQLPGGLVPTHDARGFQHMAFAIDASEFDSWEQRLIEKGIAIESHVVWDLGGRSLYFRDPDNHSIELVTPGCWPNY